MSTETPKKLFDKSKAFTIFLVQLNEAYQITVLLPMVVFMVRDFGISPQNLGIYTSILNAAFCGCQFPVSYLWGYISDIFGRRRTLLVGLVFSTIALLLFGISQTYTQALIARCFQGVFFGNLGVLKAYLADITDSSNRAWGFTMIAFAFGFGTVVGSVIGGLLIITSDPDLEDEFYDETTSIIPFEPFNTRIPYFPPILIGGIIAIIGIIMTLLFVHDEKIKLDTNMLIKGTTKDSHSNEGDGNLTLEHSLISSIEQTRPGQSQAYAMTTPRDVITKDKIKTPLIKSVVKPKDSMDINDDDINTVKDLFTKTKFIHGLILYGGTAIGWMMYKEMGPVFMAQALDFNSQLIGYAIAFSGLVMLVFSYYIQPIILKKWKYKNVNFWANVVLVIILLLSPAVYFLKIEPFNFNRGLLVVSICLLELIGTSGASLAFCLSTCYVNNLVPPKHVGKANGVGQTLASFVRAIGPTITGFIWSDLSYPYFEEYLYPIFFAYLPAAIIYTICAIDSYVYIKHEYQLSYIDRKLIHIKNKQNNDNSIKISMQLMKNNHNQP